MTASGFTKVAVLVTGQWVSFPEWVVSSLQQSSVSGLLNPGSLRSPKTNQLNDSWESHLSSLASSPGKGVGRLNGTITFSLLSLKA